MTTRWSKTVVDATKKALAAHSNPMRADGAAKYMKNIAPFLGIATPERRAFTKAAWKELPQPTSDDLGSAALALFALAEREYHYAACDLIEKFIASTDEYFIAEYLEPLLITKSWWDSVDALVNAGVSPLCHRYDASDIINEWSSSDNIWLVRAAIGHQRGWKKDTDIKRVFEICHQHWDEKEFFIAKAIGWALRDITRLNPKSVRDFLQRHPSPNTVATREAQRGLDRFLA